MLRRHENNTVDLMTLDGISDTITSLLLWLSSAESYLSEAKSVHGDVETVTMLMQQHQARMLRMLVFFSPRLRRSVTWSEDCPANLAIDLIVLHAMFAIV